jgi:hypothetical protein
MTTTQCPDSHHCSDCGAPVSVDEYHRLGEEEDGESGCCGQRLSYPAGDPVNECNH